MSGPNQHYIPSFLQRAFGIRPERREIWYFGRGEPAERRSVKRTASEDFFYSEPRSDGRPTLDDSITQKESDLARLLKEVRSKSPGSAVESATAAMIVSHLAQRTAHVRTTFSEGLGRLLALAQAIFGERADVETLMGLDGGVPTSLFRDRVTSELTAALEGVPLNMPHRVLERMAFILAKEHRDELVDQGKGLVNAVLCGLRPDSPEFVRDTHNKALGELIESSEYEVLLRTFNWSVHLGPATGAILPDCVVVAVGLDGIAGNHLIVGGKETAAMVLAVAPDRLLVGLRPGFALPCEFDYNREAACLCHTFFLATRNDEETGRLHAKIGSRFGPDVEAAVEHGFDDFVKRGSSADAKEDGLDVDTVAWKPTTGGRYELSVAGYDRLTTETIQGEVVSLVDELATTMPLERLDGIMIEKDYPGMLRAMTRGWENAPTLETQPSDIGVDNAQTVAVRRSGVVKGLIVVSSTVSDALVSRNAAQRAWGTHALVRQLASVALMEIVEECLPGTLPWQVGEGIDGWFYAYVHGAPESFVASRRAARFGNPENVAQELRELLGACFDWMVSAIPRERLAYREHGDLDRLLGVALPAIRRVLMVAADLLGHCASTGEQPLAGNSALDESLDRAGLRAWLGVYFDDLARFHRRLGRWETFEEFLAFNIHAERLLFAFGMFARETPEGLRVEVPLHTDMEALIAMYSQD